MDEKTFVWSSDLTRRFFELRFENDWLFKKLKQPWGEFYKILQENGFPEEMTISHVRKKWSYTYDSYKIAKRTKNKDWKYYKMFDKHYGKTKILDKYGSWNDEWRLKLITCIFQAKEAKLDFQNMWSVTERALRCQELPIDCCIQDIKGLWHHIKMIFNRKHRINIRRGGKTSDWPLFNEMMKYFKKHDPEYLGRLKDENNLNAKIKSMYHDKKKVNVNEKHEFQWSKDITESFIQIRLQQDWLFRERKWAWKDLRNIMIEEYGFPKTLTSRELCRKWAATFSEYQKAKATNNKTWAYYQIFELYLGEGTLSLNPLVGWQEEWVLNLISTRAEYDRLFSFQHRNKDRCNGWREVEKKLRTVGIPLDHTLLELEDMWSHLIKTYRWKRKFASKGILNEHWPYFDAMARYMENKMEPVTKQKEENFMYEDAAVDEDEDDIKLLDLKHRMELVKPKYEYFEVNQCRTCSAEEGCVSVFERDEDGLDLAHKLQVIAGIEVQQTDALSSQICLNCMHELENAYKFRCRCQETDKELRNNASKIKIELKLDEQIQPTNINTQDSLDMDTDAHYEDIPLEADETIKEEKVVRRKKKMRKQRYDYWKICDVCGKHTRNLVSHLDAHSKDKGYSCDVCEKKFKFKSGLIIHKAIHDPTPKKTCEVCGKTFHILAQYRRHFVYHANERKYSCETCGKRFNTMDILKVHNRSHTDERPFSCQECGKTFRTAGCVSRHKKIVHRNIR